MDFLLKVVNFVSVLIRGVKCLVKLPMGSLVLVLGAYSLAVIYAAQCVGVLAPESGFFDGYSSKFNWMAYPLFWFVSSILLYQSWTQFSAAWKEMFLHGRVHEQHGFEKNNFQ